MRGWIVLGVLMAVPQLAAPCPKGSPSRRSWPTASGIPPSLEGSRLTVHRGSAGLGGFVELLPPRELPLDGFGLRVRLVAGEFPSELGGTAARYERLIFYFVDRGPPHRPIHARVKAALVSGDGTVGPWTEFDVVDELVTGHLGMASRWDWAAPGGLALLLAVFYMRRRVLSARLALPPETPPATAAP